jgi:hypothetical protein
MIQKKLMTNDEKIEQIRLQMENEKLMNKYKPPEEQYDF